jgi:hypothetical protein
LVKKPSTYRSYAVKITNKSVATIRVTGKGQVAISQNVRENLGILPVQTEIEFMQDDTGRW